MQFSEQIQRLAACCDKVAAIDDEVRQLRYKIHQLDSVIDVLRSSWKMGADAVRSTARHDTNTARLEKIEAYKADISDLTDVREQLTKEALRLYQETPQSEKEGAALVLRNFCGICEPWDALRAERQRHERELQAMRKR